MVPIYTEKGGKSSDSGGEGCKAAELRRIFGEEAPSVLPLSHRSELPENPGAGGGLSGSVPTAVKLPKDGGPLSKVALGVIDGVCPLVAGGSQVRLKRKV